MKTIAILAIAAAALVSCQQQQTQQLPPPPPADPRPTPVPGKEREGVPKISDFDPSGLASTGQIFFNIVDTIGSTASATLHQNQ